MVVSIHIFPQKKPIVAQHLESKGADYSKYLATIYRQTQGLRDNRTHQTTVSIHVKNYVLAMQRD